jgi:putative nucleotidyltransferase with HDIG domain
MVFKHLKEKKGFWFEPYYWEHFDTKLITYSKAVSSGDDVLGVIGIDIDVEYIVGYFEQNKVYKKAETLILDENHNILIRPGNVYQTGPLNSDSDFSSAEFPSELNTIINNHVEAHQIDHKKNCVFESENYLISHSDLSNGWIMMTYTPKSEILAPINSFFTFVLITVIIFMIFAIATSRFIANLISKPLESLALKIKGFKMDESIKIEKTGIVELDTITDSFNHMADSVIYSYEVIRGQNIELEKSSKASETLAKNLEEILNLTSSISIMAANDETDYLINVLRISKSMIKHADKAFIAKSVNGNLEYFCSVGDFEQDKKDKYFSGLNSKKSGVLRSQFEENIENINYIYSPLGFADNLLGAIILVNSGKESIVFSSEDKKFLNTFSNLAASYFGVQQQMNIKTKFRESILYAIIKLVELHDPYTKGHSESVSKLSVLIARQMGLSDKSVSTIKWAGLVHDIGKILIPKEILTKPSNLNGEEYSIIKKHPEYGAKVLRASEEISEVASIVRYHHERWDGNGYPDGIKGVEIPLESRIIAVADSLDAMISNRPYRKGLPLETARDEIVKNSGTQFDPEVVRVFLEIDLVNEFTRVDDELKN